MRSAVLRPCSWDKKKNLDQKVYNSDTPYQTRADAFWFFSNRRDSNIGLFGGGEERAGPLPTPLQQPNTARPLPCHRAFHRAHARGVSVPRAGCRTAVFRSAAPVHNAWRACACVFVC